MKKMILTAAGIAATFVAFAFAPVEKNNAMDNTFVATAEAAAGCDDFYKTYADASECWSTSTPEKPKLAEAQRMVLYSY